MRVPTSLALSSASGEPEPFDHSRMDHHLMRDSTLRAGALPRDTRTALFLSTTAALTLAMTSPGAVTVHDSFPQWSADAGTFTTITFGEIPVFSNVTDQYASLGVLFTDSGPNKTLGFDPVVFPQDGYGLNGGAMIELTLLSPALGIAAHFPGFLRFRLYWGESLIYASPLVGASGYANFRGYISDSLFDRVELLGIPNDPMDIIGLDNLYISFVPVPAPGAALGLLALAACGGRRRRR